MLTTVHTGFQKALEGQADEQRLDGAITIEEEKEVVRQGGD